MFLQDQFSQYGLDAEQWQIIISNVEMLWQQMSLPIKELMLFEGIENSQIAICNALNFPIILLNYLKGATFSNVNELKKALYQDNIIPEGESFMSALNDFLNLPSQNLLLEADFSHVQILQADAKYEVEKDNITVDIIRKLQADIQGGITTIEAASAILKIILSMPDDEINQMLSPRIINDPIITI